MEREEKYSSERQNECVGFVPGEAECLQRKYVTMPAFFDIWNSSVMIVWWEKHIVPALLIIMLGSDFTPASFKATVRPQSQLWIELRHCNT